MKINPKLRKLHEKSKKVNMRKSNINYPYGSQSRLSVYERLNSILRFQKTYFLLPPRFRFPSVMQVKLQHVSEVSADLWNISLESLIWLRNAFRADLFPKKNVCFRFASVLLPFCFRHAGKVIWFQGFRKRHMSFGKHFCSSGFMYWE